MKLLRVILWPIGHPILLLALCILLPGGGYLPVTAFLVMYLWTAWRESGGHEGEVEG